MCGRGPPTSGCARRSFGVHAAGALPDEAANESGQVAEASREGDVPPRKVFETSRAARRAFICSSYGVPPQTQITTLRRHTVHIRRPRSRMLARLGALTTIAAAVAIVAGPMGASASGSLTPGNLLVSTSQWTVNPSITAGTTQLPPGCGGANPFYTAAPCVTAQANGTYPQVFNNAGTDGSFGVTQPIVLDQLTTGGTLVNQTTVPYSSSPSTSDQMVTSFSSKSELGLNQSTDDNYVTFMGYDAPAGSLDLSNSDTPGA